MFRSLLAKEFAPYASLSKEQLDLAASHHDLLQQWNARMNLTRIESLKTWSACTIASPSSSDPGYW